MEKKMENEMETGGRGLGFGICCFAFGNPRCLDTGFLVRIWVSMWLMV